MIKIPLTRRCKYPNCHAIVKKPLNYCSIHQNMEHKNIYSNHYQQHKYNVITRRNTQSKIKRYGFYQSQLWKNLRQIVLYRDNYLCQYCLLHKKITPAKMVDHTIPIERNPQLKDNLTNLKTICHACHNLKTSWEHHFYKNYDDSTIQEIKNYKQIDKLMRQ